MTEGTFALALALVDAGGGGVCRLRSDGVIVDASPRFLVLAGASEVVGKPIHQVLLDLPELAELPERVGADTPTLLQVGADGLGRELSAARLELGEHSFVVLSDRSSAASLGRSVAKLERQVGDLQASLAEHADDPRRSRIRTAAGVAARMDEALMRARRYKHDVTLLTIRIAAEHAEVVLLGPVSECLLDCVRGVDDVGRLADDHWLLVLPHTNLEGGSVVGKRVFERLGKLGIGTIGIGCAQVGREEAGPKAIERAEQAGLDALEQGGGQLLAVALV